MQREIVQTRKTVTSLAVASTSNQILIKNTLDQTKLSLERHEGSDMKQHEATQKMLHLERELIQSNADSLNHLKTLLESFYTTFLQSLQSMYTAPNP